MKMFTISKTKEVTFLGAVFATREQAEQHSDSVIFVHERHAHIMGYPCGGFVPLNDMGTDKTIHTVRH